MIGHASASRQTAIGYSKQQAKRRSRLDLALFARGRARRRFCEWITVENRIDRLVVGDRTIVEGSRTFDRVTNRFESIGDSQISAAVVEFDNAQICESWEVIVDQ